MGERTTFIRFISLLGVGLIAALASVGAGGQSADSSVDQAAERKPAAPYFSGADLFKTYCASCHGSSAKGDGPLAAYMKKPPPDLTLFAVRNGGTYPGELVRKIIDGRQPLAGHGGPDMPAWGDAFKESRGGQSEESIKARIDALVRHLEGLQLRSARNSGAWEQASAP